MKTILSATLFLLITLSSAYTAGPSERRFIHKGMSEAEVLRKIGSPDSETFDSGNGATRTVRRWIYLPTSGDEQTTTTIVLKNGKVISVASEITRDRPSASERRFISEGMSQGEVLTRIGAPDRESLDSGGGATETIMRWIYFPSPGDNQTTTTIVLKAGKVIEVVREIASG
jgi:hypothetical protein